MSLKLIDESNADNGRARFTVIGVGGGGSNAVDHMVRSGIQGVTFICANTDKQALDRMAAAEKLQLGIQSTRGLGAGANPEVGRLAAEEETASIQQMLEGADMVFVTAGMGGGTGTGAAPVIASIAKDMGILTVGVVTTPFRLEGNKRFKAAEKGIEELSQHVDSLIIIPNEKLLTVYGDITMAEAYKKADDVLLNAVRSIFDVIVNHGRINLDFADLKTAMSTRGYAMMGIGSARGDDRARQATEMAIRSPLLDNIVLENAKGILVNITASEDIKGSEFQTIADVVSQISDLDEGDIFYGNVIDPNAGDELRVTVVATGLNRLETDTPRSRRSGTTIGGLNHRSGAAVTEEEDLPAIARRPPTGPDASFNEQRPAERPAPINVQDFLKNQQRNNS